MKDKLNVMPFPAGAMHYRMAWNGRGGERYIKCFCQQFSSFNRKKDQNKRFEGGGRGHRGPWTWQRECMWRRWQVDEEEEECGGGIYLKKKQKKKKAFEWKTKASGFNPGWGWTCHQVGFSGRQWQRWHLPTGQRALSSPCAALAPLAPPPHCQDTLQMQQKDNPLTQGMQQWRLFNECYIYIYSNKYK